MGCVQNNEKQSKTKSGVEGGRSLRGTARDILKALRVDGCWSLAGRLAVPIRLLSAQSDPESPVRFRLVVDALSSAGELNVVAPKQDWEKVMWTFARNDGFIMSRQTAADGDG